MRYSDREVDEAVLASQIARHRERTTSPEWTVIADELTPLLGGGIWRHTPMATLTIDEVEAITARRHADEAARHVPKPTAIRAVFALVSALGDLGPEDQRDVRRILTDELAELDTLAWGKFDALLRSGAADHLPDHDGFCPALDEDNDERDCTCLGRIATLKARDS